VTEPYTTLIQGRTPDLAKAVASYCRDHVPTATKAVFDGEVYLDIPGGRTSGDIHLRRHGGDGAQRRVRERVVRGPGVEHGEDQKERSRTTGSRSHSP
jgi:hypothetical protein